MEQSCSVYVTHIALGYSVDFLVPLFEEAGPLAFVEVLPRNREYLPRPGGEPERRAAYIHYCDLVSAKTGCKWGHAQWGLKWARCI